VIAPTVTRKVRDRSRRESPAAQALRSYLRRVLREQARALDDLGPDPVHDLRVALRRCRSLAEGFADLDKYAAWRRLRKSSKRLQHNLAELRDVHVMSGWVHRLRLNTGPGGAELGKSLDREERRARRAARAALKDFQHKQWKHWKRRLPARAQQLPADAAHFAAVASRRLDQARAYDLPCRRHRGRTACHRLRVALKRFRYTVESFLPLQQATWGRDLKRLQGFLGEVHDLDVLRARLLVVAREQGLPRETRERWLARIERARGQRLDRYERWISGKAASGGRGHPQSLWDLWRGDLEAAARVNRPASAAASP
jgi:CHAD domain-containing protein